MPKEFVRFCTTIMAREKMACVRPLGSPSLHRRFTNETFGQRVLRVTVKCSLIFRSRTMHSTPEMNCDTIVAQAAPATPILKPATNQISRPMFSMQAVKRNTRGMMESPRPLSTPEMTL